MDVVLYRGKLPRSELGAVVGTGDRQARRIAATLLNLGVLDSESSRAPLCLVLPATLASLWMPGLFPEKRFMAILKPGADWRLTVELIRILANR